AATTYGRCPNGSGPMTTTTSSTRGAANDCSSPLVINEVESDGDLAGDWVEIYNAGSASIDLTGWGGVDNDGTHAIKQFPAGTTITAGGYAVLFTEPAPGFGLGAPDSVTLYAPGGTLAVDTYSWASHATTTFGRCPNGTGPFATTTAATPGA